MRTHFFNQVGRDGVNGNAAVEVGIGGGVVVGVNNGFGSGFDGRPGMTVVLLQAASANRVSRESVFFHVVVLAVWCPGRLKMFRRPCCFVAKPSRRYRLWVRSLSVRATEAGAGCFWSLF